MPWIDLDGADNVRDLGGMPTTDGGQTAAGRLLRGDNLQELTSADVATLVDDVGVTTIVDLRSASERTSEGPAPLDGVAGLRLAHHPVLPELGAAADVVADALLTRREQDRSRYPDDPAAGHYLGYLEDRPDEVVAAVRTIARSQGAALVHCAAGKDRTGVVVALALTAVGVRRDAVIADYAATGERNEAVLARLRRSPTYAADLDGTTDEQHRPRPETMAAFLDQVDARYGGAVRWLSAHGFTPDDLRLLQAKLTPPPNTPR
jgi:protein-tyrosine phosphatase